MSNGANLEKATPTKGRVALLVVVVGGDGIHAVCGVWDMRYGTISNFGKFGGTVDINIPRSMGQSFNLMKEHSLSFCKIRETD